MATDLASDERTEVFQSERPISVLLDRLTRHVDTLEMNGDSSSCRLNQESATFPAANQWEVA